MNRTELIKKLQAGGAVFSRHGAKHDWWTNYEKGVSQAVPRHNEIKNPTAWAIIKKLTYWNN
jgi:hypothetical protein